MSTVNFEKEGKAKRCYKIKMSALLIRYLNTRYFLQKDVHPSPRSPRRCGRLPSQLPDMGFSGKVFMVLHDLCLYL